jgi:methylglyoxal synthase
MFAHSMKSSWSLLEHKSQLEFLTFHLSLNARAHKVDHVQVAAIVAVVAVVDIAVAIAVAVANQTNS